MQGFLRRINQSIRVVRIARICWSTSSTSSTTWPSVSIGRSVSAGMEKLDRILHHFPPPPPLLLPLLLLQLPLLRLVPFIPTISFDRRFGGRLIIGRGIWRSLSTSLTYRHQWFIHLVCDDAISAENNDNQLMMSIWSVRPARLHLSLHLCFFLSFSL